MYATTKQFLDYFNLSSLEQLPPLSEIRDLDEINRGLSLEEDKPVGRIIEFPDPGESEQDLGVDEEAEKAAEIGLRPISEILSMVDSQLGIAPAMDEMEAASGAAEEPDTTEAGQDAAAVAAPPEESPPEPEKS